MVAKLTKVSQLPQHTAGIFADMSIDGPPIGTLVVIIDRAKNLPNRKTMGKQNPYCAARLGKEAKKTETDMRGGQRPKWDQELRFTVHESPDYYQLKVSVFNDDKKTDLIGETTIDLKNVVVPGGGQNDLWHGLQCKGKYAGDIRIELTYYDTRPKDEAVIERRKEAEKVETRAETVQSGLSGPRQAKPSKRRPLPADPTGSSPVRPPSSDRVAPPPTALRENHSTPSRQAIPEPPPQSTPPSQPQRAYETSDDFQCQWGPTPPKIISKHSTPTHQSYQNSSPGEIQELPVDQYGRRSQHPITSREMAYPQVPEYTHITHHQPLDHSPPHNIGQNVYDYPPEPPPIPPPRDCYQTPPRQTTYSMQTPDRYNTSPSYPPPSRGSSYAATDSPQTQQSPEPPTNASPNDRRSHYHRYSTSHANNDVFRDSPLRHSLNNPDFPPRQEYMQPHLQNEEEEGPPPPPPVHRQIFHSQQHLQQLPTLPSVTADYGHNQNALGPIPMPEPLSIGPGRTSPLPLPVGEQGQQYIAYSSSYHSQNLSFSSVDREPVSAYSSSPTPSYMNAHANTNVNSYARDRMAAAPVQEQPGTSDGDIKVIASVPSALVPGYKAAVPEEAERSMIYHNNSYVSPPPQPQPHQQPPSPQPQPQPQPSRTSPRPPDLRSIPARKSVSPHPHQPPAPRDPTNPSLPGIPFSPDSYNALNPSVSTAFTSISSSIPTYQESALEADRQREVDKLRDLGPIIGDDGRVIDPSDHLPTDTWAPEPERKFATVSGSGGAGGGKRAEVVVRFKHAGQRDSASVGSGVRGRAVSMIGVSGRVGNGNRQTRAKLQKRETPQPAPASASSRPQSYIHVQHSHETTPSPRASGIITNNNTSSITTTPLRSHDPYGYNGTPTASTSAHSPNIRTSPSPSSFYKPSPTGPPIPAKVPVQPSASYGGGEMDAFSEELRRIDIGVGSGGCVGGGGRRGRLSYVGTGGREG
ncbi:hypothetical protein PABG_07055 [Paracoccidioides brasiliensis Pb03]|nr:hypothetical protein PABG_07055 [Paracoccidioides brasiliensis Pb03]